MSFAVGIGLNTQATAAEVATAIADAMAAIDLAPGDVAVFATAEHRRGHPALWAFDLIYLPDAKFAERTVCETAAMSAANGGMLVVPKRCTANVCVAIARFRTLA